MRRESRIKCHFLICYIALCILRYIEYKLDKDNKHKGSERIVDSLNKVQISCIKHKKSYIISTYNFSEDCQDIFNALRVKPLSPRENEVSLRLKYGIEDLAPYWATYDDKPRHLVKKPNGRKESKM